ncbi:hypothetical protein PT7_1376 [Pusillimonas sp. T7-7]|uniref:anti-virulence regulator CigR family protein n=1 Tax=Pusillimonas sp. (strain T7-7) TaxID=1007105 RepID=UPI0002084896|nr:anti-virulence regulator CigR family protein [Pusillimonas sp. T7-7]AEC19916.1 hypothetical protein PT7_1376 [Pusillimonas sp. T7-7]
MNRRTLLIASILAGSGLTFAVQAAPPEGKGQGNGKGNSSKGGGNGKGNGNGNSGNAGNNGNSGQPGNSGAHGGGKPSQAQGYTSSGGTDHHDRYDAQGRYYDYFDDHRDSHGQLRDGDIYADLIYAGITAALAREYALDFGFGGYSSLPPGIRKNLARGKPLPPGIAKKMVPGSLLGRLPRHPGYEWRIAGTDLILISVATAVIADILYDVF